MCFNRIVISHSMAKRVSINFNKSKSAYPVFTYGSSFNTLTLTPHLAYTVDFQAGVPDLVRQVIVKDLSEITNRKGYKIFNKIHQSILPVEYTLEEAATLAETQKTCQVFQKRERTSDCLLIVGSEDYFVSRQKKFKGDVAYRVTNLKGVYVTVGECVSTNPRERFAHHHEKTILSWKTKFTLSSNPHLQVFQKAKMLSKEIQAEVLSTTATWKKTIQ